MSFTSGSLTPDSLRVHPGGAELLVSIPWYRSLPLSSLLVLEISIDGQAVAVEDITLIINGASHAFAELAKIWDEFWFIQDRAAVSIPLARPLEAGQLVSVTVRSDWRIPYIITGPDSVLTNSVTVSRELTVQPADELAGAHA